MADSDRIIDDLKAREAEILQGIVDRLRPPAVQAAIATLASPAPLDAAWITVQYDKTERDQHRVQLEHDGLTGGGIGENSDSAMCRALHALSGAFFQRSIQAGVTHDESELEP